MDLVTRECERKRELSCKVEGEELIHRREKTLLIACQKSEQSSDKVA